MMTRTTFGIHDLIFFPPHRQLARAAGPPASLGPPTATNETSSLLEPEGEGVAQQLCFSASLCLCGEEAKLGQLGAPQPALSQRSMSKGLAGSATWEPEARRKNAGGERQQKTMPAKTKRSEKTPPEPIRFRPKQLSSKTIAAGASHPGRIARGIPRLLCHRRAAE